MNNTHDRPSPDDQTEIEREEQLLQEVRDLLLGINVSSHQNANIELGSQLRAVPAIEQESHQIVNEPQEWEIVLRICARAFNAGRLSGEAYSEIQSRYTRRRFLGFRDGNLPSIFESQEIWESSRDMNEEDWLERINIDNLSVSAYQRFDEWTQHNKQLVPEWTIRQVLSLKEYPNSDGIGGSIKILYFNKGDNEGEFVDLIY